jgi:hypothetical protein
MKFYLGELEVRNYTLTVFSESEDEIKKLMKKEWARYKRQTLASQTWNEKKEELYIQPVELNKVEWR